MVNGAASSPHVPRIFVDDPGAAASGLLSVHGSIVHRLSRVLRLRRGDRLEVIHADTFYEATLLRVGRDTAEAEIVSSRPVRPEPPPSVMALCSQPGPESDMYPLMREKKGRRDSSRR